MKSFRWANPSRFKFLTLSLEICMDSIFGSETDERTESVSERSNLSLLAFRGVTHDCTLSLLLSLVTSPDNSQPVLVHGPLRPRFQDPRVRDHRTQLALSPSQQQPLLCPPRNHSRHHPSSNLNRTSESRPTRPRARLYHNHSHFVSFPFSLAALYSCYSQLASLPLRTKV